jgi:hypothetical protein
MHDSTVKSCNVIFFPSQVIIKKLFFAFRMNVSIVFIQFEFKTISMILKLIKFATLI